MKPQAFQPGELRDENNNIIREGAYGKKTPFCNAENMGILDYLINNLDVLYKGIVAAGLVIYDKNGTPVLPDEIKAALQSYVTSAKTSEINAASSATKAATSASTAQTAATTATTKAKEASSSATNAASSASTAQSAATTATTKASEAATSASTSKSNATAAIEAKNVAVTKAQEASTDAAKAKNYADSAAAITLAAGTVYIDTEGYINILEVK